MKPVLLTVAEVRLVDALAHVRGCQESVRFRVAQAQQPDLLIERKRSELRLAVSELETSVATLRAMPMTKSDETRPMQVTQADDRVINAMYDLRVKLCRKSLLRSGPQSTEAERADLAISRAERELEQALRGADITGWVSR